MKIRHVIVLSAAAGTAIGFASSHTLKAQTNLPVYLIGEIEVRNPEGYSKDYLPKAREIIKAHGGQLIAAAGAAGRTQVVPIDGEAPNRLVIYRYPSIEAVHAWRNDPEYKQIRKVGEKYATYRTFAVEGIGQ